MPSSTRLVLPRRKLVTQYETEVVKTSRLRPESSLLMLEPACEDIDLAGWCRLNRPQVEQLLLQHGALLFRGFEMGVVERFEKFALTLCPQLFRDNGEHPRQSVSGKVYTPVFYPSEQRLLWHNENSFNQQWPMKIMFACAQPAILGGHTPIVDSRKVCAAIEPGIRERFINKQIMYVRNYGNGLGLDWSTVFRTDSKEEVEEQCRRAGFQYEWKKGGRLRTKCVRPAIVSHPKSGELVWFAQPQHWHVSCLDPATRESMQAMFSEEDWARHCYYGDETPISDAEMQSILDVYARLEERFTWERGDVLLLDNLLTAHGRDPYIGERKLLVAMGEMGNF